MRRLRRHVDQADEADQAIGLLRAEMRSERRFAAVLVVFALLAATLLTVALIVGLSSGWAAVGVVLCLLPTLYAAGALLQGAHRSVRALEEVESPAAVGPLLAALDLASGERRRAVVRALMRLAPALPPEAAAQLGSGARAGLGRALTVLDPERDAGLLMALVGLTEHVGDPHVAARLEPLAGGRGASVREQAVRDEAARVLAAFRAHAEAAARAAPLLRPAEEPAGERLVRPVAGTSGADTAALLRPTDEG